MRFSRWCGNDRIAMAVIGQLALVAAGVDALLVLPTGTRQLELADLGLGLDGAGPFEPGLVRRAGVHGDEARDLVGVGLGVEEHHIGTKGLADQEVRRLGDGTRKGGLRGPQPMTAER
jgi:hypothetical protein